MKVGSVMARINGANVAVGDIYDQKLFAQSTPTEYVDSDTYVLFRADDYGVFGEECGNSFEIKNPQYSAVETHEYQNSDNYFIHVSNTSRVWVTLDCTDFFTAAASQGYTIDGIFYYPASRYNRYQRLIEFSYYPVNIKSYGTSANLQVAATFLTNSTTTVTLDNDIFAQPFHFAFVHYGGTIKVYFNGVLKCTKTAAIRNKNNNLLTVGNVDTTGTTSDISCAFLRLSTGQRWTENFTPNFGTVIRGFSKPYCLAIRHNNQTYYAPLVTTNNPPCIAVRHNNQTYYTVRS